MKKGRKRMPYAYMIGDWVRHDGQYRRIVGLDCENVILEVPERDEVTITCYEDIEAIPLTPELLEDNGFERVVKVHDVGVWRLDRLVMRKRENGSYMSTNIEVRYLHELQHLMILQGMFVEASELAPPPARVRYYERPATNGGGKVYILEFRDRDDWDRAVAWAINAAK